MTARANKRSKAPIIVTIVVVVLVLLGIGTKLAYDYCSEQFLLATHPMKYTEYVSEYAEEFDVPEMLVFAVIKTESGFRTDARSNLGARGLMQIMEDTFDWIKFRLDDESAVYDDMYSARENIRYGTYLLGYLLRYFDGQTEVAVAAYHAGVGEVSGWLGDSEYSDDGVTLKKIPISDTAHYVDKINNALAVYEKLYNGGI